jgi:hypothetical protein
VEEDDGEEMKIEGEVEEHYSIVFAQQIILYLVCKQILYWYQVPVLVKDLEINLYQYHTTPHSTSRYRYHRYQVYMYHTNTTHRTG